ncbi:MAG: ribosome maturation factor RimP [Candidatus Krumholzibacteriia bacterium]
MESNELESLVAAELDLLGLECVKLEIVGARQSPTIRLYIDKEGGVSVGDCAQASRTLGALLDRVDPFPGRYLLEVSSPGISRPLTREDHFVRFVGSQIRAQCANPEVGKKTYTGQIRSCINGMLVLDTSEGQQLIRLADIVSANLTAREYKIDKKRKRSKKH